MRRDRRAPLRGDGFTLVEILISLVIVSVGICGILALVTATMKASGDVVQGGFASLTARSVYEAIRAGARQQSFTLQDTGTARIYKGFLLIHDGVEDAGSTTPPALPSPLDSATVGQSKLTALEASDFAIFLPPAPTTGSDSYYVFPRPGGSAAGGGVDPSGISAENVACADDSYTSGHVGYGGETLVYDIRRVYRLKDRPATFTGEASDQYGFVVAVRRAAVPDLVDTSGAALPWATSSGTLDAGVFPPGHVTTTVNPSDGLYQVEVMIFRNFEPFTKTSHTAVDPGELKRTNEPVKGGHFTGLIQLGP